MKKEKSCINIFLYCVIAILFLSASQAMSNTFKTSDGVILSYEVIGDGSPLVMMHSGMMSRDDMQAQTLFFSNYYKVIALDAREQGRSSGSPKQISYELMSNDVVELLNHLDIKEANIFGQSDGGITALLTTHRYPNLISKLIIHGAVFSYKGYPPEAIEAMKNYSWDAGNPKHNDRSLFPGLAIESYLLGHEDLSGFENHLQEMAKMWSSSPNLTIADLNRIKTPTLIIVGDHDDVSLRHTVEMHEALSNSQLFVVPGGTHYIHQEKPAFLHKAMYDFLIGK